MPSGTRGAAKYWKSPSWYSIYENAHVVLDQVEYQKHYNFFASRFGEAEGTAGFRDDLLQRGCMDHLQGQNGNRGIRLCSKHLATQVLFSSCEAFYYCYRLIIPKHSTGKKIGFKLPGNAKDSKHIFQPLFVVFAVIIYNPFWCWPYLFSNP